LILSFFVLEFLLPRVARHATFAIPSWWWRARPRRALDKVRQVVGYQYHAEIDRRRSRHQTAREMSLQRITNSLTHNVVAWGETCPNLVETQGLSEFSDHLEDGGTTERNWYKASEGREKEKGIQVQLSITHP